MKSILAVVLFFATGLSAADPQLVGMVMPDAKVLAGINVEQARTSRFGQYLLAQLQAEEQHLQELKDLTGFDPRQDIQEVLVASAAVPGQKGGLVLVRGRFDVDRIVAALKAKEQNFENYNGARLLVNPKGTRALALDGSTLAVAGDAAAVRAALDRRTAPSQLDAAAAVKVNSLSTTQDAWALSLVPLSQLQPRRTTNPDTQGILKGDVLQKIDQASAGVKFGDVVRLSGEAVAQTDQDATALADVIRFLAGMAQMRAGAQNPVPAQVLQGLMVSAQGKNVSIGLAIPEEQLEGLVHPRPRRAALR